ncbi:hypothetical protein HYQ46_011277 [Verticillium longisporum]|nr:hypothetical protein HYQ46_011277 [Verticillium longisporum]
MFLHDQSAAHEHFQLQSRRVLEIERLALLLGQLDRGTEVPRMVHDGLDFDDGVHDANFLLVQAAQADDLITTILPQRI